MRKLLLWLLENFFPEEKEPEHPKPPSGGEVAPSTPVPMARPFKMMTDMKLLHAPYKFKYNKDYALVIHFAACRKTWSATDFFEWMLEMRFNTYYIDGKGEAWCNHDIDRCGWHAGKGIKSQYKKFKHKNAGIEIANEGMLTPHYGSRGIIYWESWFGHKLTADQVRYVTTEEGYQCEGWYAKLLPEQEEKLAEMIKWHISKGIPPENIIGHDEIYDPHGYKNDIGGALSLPLKEFVKQRCL